jgi:hypothetical protein
MLCLTFTEVLSPFAIVYAQVEAQNNASELESTENQTSETASDELEVEEVEMQHEDSNTELDDVQVEDDEIVPQSQEGEAGDTEAESSEGMEEEVEAVEEEDIAAVSDQTTATTTLDYEAQQSTSSVTTLATTTQEEGDHASTTNTTIVSGESIALANVLNMVNSNFVNSEGVVLFSNFFDTVKGAIDFRQYFGSMMDLGCSLVSCQGNDVVVNVDNNASIDNEILVSATSGNNEINGAGNATIETGDAYAGLNLINVANTNLVDSNYLLVTLNAFQGVNGDIVFPSLSQFFNTLAQGATTPEVIDINSSAAVNNNVNVDANSGDNTATGVGGGSINTGNSQSSSNVFNQLNSSLIGGQSVSVVFRVHGNWAGEVFGAPDNLAWTAGDDGSIYLFDVGGTGGSGSLNMYGTSTARINNNVNVVALTGQNAITDAETAVISTGNAYAGANVINVANANVIGRNWILAVINIFGDFNGNIAFGRPDLWVGGQVDVPRKIQNGSVLTYTYTIINNGDSPASNVRFITDLNGEYLNVTDASTEYVQEAGGVMQWQLGTIPAGAATEVSYSAVIQNTDRGTTITNEARVQGRETDNNNADNKETLTVKTDKKKDGEGIRIELGKTTRTTAVTEETEMHGLTLEAKRLTPMVSMNIGNSSTEQRLVLKNTTGSVAKNVILHDILKDDQGTLIRDEAWHLGDVLAGEEIELSYIISFNPSAKYGEYTLDTLIRGENTSVDFKGNGKIVYEALTVPPLPMVLGATNDTSASFGFSKADTVSDAVYHGKETPLVPPANALANVAYAAEGEGAPSKTSFPLDPLFVFFTMSSLFLAYSVYRMYRLR